MSLDKAVEEPLTVAIHFAGEDIADGAIEQDSVRARKAQ